MLLRIIYMGLKSLTITPMYTGETLRRSTQNLSYIIIMG